MKGMEKLVSDLVPAEAIAEARRSPGKWIELPRRWLEKEPSSWCSEVRNGKKQYLGKETARWDAAFKPTGRVSQGKYEYAISIVSLGPSFAAVPSSSISTPVVLLDEEEEEDNSLG